MTFKYSNLSNIGAALVMMALLFGCSGSGEPSAGLADKAPGPVIQGLDHGRDNGKNYYLRFCSHCHGDDARGKGPNAEKLEIAPPDLNRIVKSYTKDRIIYVVLNGSAKIGKSSFLPPFNLTLSEDTVTDIISYLTYLSVQQTPKEAENDGTGR